MKKIRILLSTSKARTDQAYLRLTDPAASTLKDPDRAELIRQERLKSKRRLQRLHEDIELEETEEQIATKKVVDKREKNEATIAGWAIKKSVDSKFKGRDEKSAAPDAAELDEIKDEAPTDEDLESVLNEEIGADDEGTEDEDSDPFGEI